MYSAGEKETQEGGTSGQIAGCKSGGSKYSLPVTCDILREAESSKSQRH